jgi:hypothetical protein
MHHRSGRAVAVRLPTARVLRRLTIGCACAALVSALLLLVQDVAPALTLSVRHTWLSASALLFAGSACLGGASAVKAHAREVTMRISLGSAFVLWGIQQLLHQGGASVALGDIVIVLFVVDLGAHLATTLPKTGSSAG